MQFCNYQKFNFCNYQNLRNVVIAKLLQKILIVNYKKLRKLCNYSEFNFVTIKTKKNSKSFCNKEIEQCKVKPTNILQV